MFEPMNKEEVPDPVAVIDPMAAVNVRLAEMQRQISETYRANKGFEPQAPQIQYVPYPVAQTSPEPQGLTEAEILADLPGAIQREAERIASSKEAALREELGGHLGVIYAKTFERDMKDLTAHPYYRHVAEDLQAKANAAGAEKYSPGWLMDEFHKLVGAKIQEIASATAVETVERTRSVDPGVPISSSPVASRPASKETIVLDDEREALRQYANETWGVNMTAQEWYEQETTGKHWPKNYDGGSPPIFSKE